MTLGITFFDTAPAYGDSEEKLGNWLHGLSAERRKTLVIATKCGEYWVADDQGTLVDHSFATLTAGIDASLQNLGEIDILQVHKATEEVLRSPDLSRALQYAQEQGITQFGASVSSVAAGQVAITDGRFSFLQFPLNYQNQSMIELVELCEAAGVTPIINRPVNMGGLLMEGEKEVALRDAFSFIIRTLSVGIILTGTKNPGHLEANLRIFQQLQREMSQHKS